MIYEKIYDDHPSIHDIIELMENKIAEGLAEELKAIDPSINAQYLYKISVPKGYPIYLDPMYTECGAYIKNNIPAKNTIFVKKLASQQV